MGILENALTEAQKKEAAGVPGFAKEQQGSGNQTTTTENTAPTSRSIVEATYSKIRQALGRKTKEAPTQQDFRLLDPQTARMQENLRIRSQPQPVANEQVVTSLHKAQTERT